MPGELTGPPTLTTLPHAKGMKLELEESEVGKSGDDVTEDAGPEEDKEVYPCLAVRRTPRLWK